MTPRPSAVWAVGLAPLAACAAAGAPGEPSAERLAAGERAYQKCYACHALDPAVEGVQGPHLVGIAGRTIASVPGFPYSDAMRAYAAGGGRWTSERLDAFLADPQGEAPGNEMGFFGMSDPRERAALIAWLATQG